MKTQIEKIKRNIIPVLKNYDVVKASLFGSFVRKESTKKSDVDILVEFKGKKSLLDLAGLKIELKGLLKKKVDVLTYNSLHPLLKNKILSEQRMIYEKRS